MHSWPRPARYLFFGVALFVLTAALATMAGTLRGELTSYPDEPAHYVTGVMIRDYLAAGLPAPPLQFAERYYLYYPKVAFGMWPPLFHAVEGVWGLLFSSSRLSMALLMAALTSGAALVLMSLVEKTVGWGYAVWTGALFCALPLVRTYSGMLMPDIQVALCDLAAAACFALFLETGRPRPVLGFGLYAALSLLTKSNGLALALLPPSAILLTRQWHYLIRPAFWGAGLIVIALAGPAQLFMMRYWNNTIDSDPLRPGMLSQAYGIILAVNLPWILWPLVGLGFWRTVLNRVRQGQAVEPIWATATGLFVGVLGFHSFVPIASPEPRYMIPALAVLLLFLAAGIQDFSRWLTKATRSPAWVTALAMGALVVVAYWFTTPKMPARPPMGYGEAAQAVVGLQLPQDDVVMISSTATGDGAFIAEMLFRDTRFHLFTLRAGKVLSSSNWYGNRYTSFIHSEEDAMTALRKIPVRLLLLQQPAGSVPEHHRWLNAAIAKYPTSWRYIGAFPAGSQSLESSIRLYEFIEARHLPHGKIQLDMRHTLGRRIGKE